MTMKEFLDNCDAHGGNWTMMLASGIKRLWPNDYDALPEEFTFAQTIEILNNHGVVLK